MNRYNAKKRLDLDNKTTSALEAAAQTPGTSLDGRDEAKLQIIMNEDTKMAHLYQETYGKLKANKEKDYIESLRLHDKYAYLNDGKSLDHTMSSKYNLAIDKPSIEEEMMTTEMSDEELDLVYKRYKIMQHRNKESMQDNENEAHQLITAYNAKRAFTRGKDPSFKDD